MFHAFLLTGEKKREYKLDIDFFFLRSSKLNRMVEVKIYVISQ